MAHSELLSTALEAADAAAAVHHRHRGRIRADDAARKGVSDFVSEVDLEAERAALAVIRDRFPDHAVLAEEAATESGRETSPVVHETDGPVWVVDPLDGTTNFLHDHPMYASSVGVVVDGVPVAGAIVQAATRERWWAARGEGAHRNGERIRTSGVRTLDGALVGTGFPFRRPEALAAYLNEFEKVFAQVPGIRRGGSAALDLCYVAQGSLDGFWEGRLAPWDVAAGCAILTEAGGVASRLDGTPLSFDRSGSIAAAGTSELLDRLLEVTRS